ncbi:hypothetical protein KAZ82_02440 [Candidatus Babeliales bacterium]|nr:hypothetical protein [Candidatus Babeliales bacterium]
MKKYCFILLVSISNNTIISSSALHWTDKVNPLSYYYQLKTNWLGSHNSLHRALDFTASHFNRDLWTRVILANNIDTNNPAILHIALSVQASAAIFEKLLNQGTFKFILDTNDTRPTYSFTACSCTILFLQAISPLEKAILFTPRLFPPSIAICMVKITLQQSIDDTFRQKIYETCINTNCPDKSYCPGFLPTLRELIENDKKNQKQRKIHTRNSQNAFYTLQKRANNLITKKIAQMIGL